MADTRRNGGSSPGPGRYLSSAMDHSMEKTGLA
jgi:hypothetical protein